MSPGMVISSEMIKAYDGDQPGPFSTIQYSIVNGTHAVRFAVTNSVNIYIFVVTLSLSLSF